ncbi:hypothetical protein [Carbonactinospora thermoautotrophica]|uniref:hypothetical protein n=1 Tax=Carbonactinospora thermoautotrophica TaxID=1469144 RepID=UPI00226F0BC3|nr:hypothetical protein [Carbonactinospora thermoautotrophica]
MVNFLGGGVGVAEKELGEGQVAHKGTVNQRQGFLACADGSLHITQSQQAVAFGARKLTPSVEVHAGFLGLLVVAGDQVRLGGVELPKASNFLAIPGKGASSDIGGIGAEPWLVRLGSPTLGRRCMVNAHAPAPLSSRGMEAGSLLMRLLVLGYLRASSVDEAAARIDQLQQAAVAEVLVLVDVFVGRSRAAFFSMLDRLSLQQTEGVMVLAVQQRTWDAEFQQLFRKLLDETGTRLYVAAEVERSS